MEEFWVLALLALLYQTASPSDTTEVIGVAGGAVTFPIPKTRGYAAFWSFEDDPIMAVEFGDPPRPVFSKEEYKTRFTVSERGRALSITQLSTEDAGTYSVNINGNIFTFTLQVYRELPEPTVTCKALNCSGGICFFSLSCSVPGDGFGDISYTWTGRGQWLAESSLVVLAGNKSSWDNLGPLRCTARNAVSGRSVTVTNAERLCSGLANDQCDHHRDWPMTSETITMSSGSIWWEPNTQ
ncbi:SLAM family member 7-like [Sylvia borin]